MSKGLQWVLALALLVAGGVAGWLVRDHTLPQPGLQQPRDRVVLVTDTVVKTITVVRDNLAAADSLRQVREEWQRTLDSLQQVVAADSTVPPAAREALATCQRISVACQMESSRLRTAADGALGTLLLVRDTLGLVRVALDSAIKAQPRCTESVLARMGRGAGYGGLLGAAAGGAVAVLVPRADALTALLVAPGTGLVAGAAAGGLTKCTH